MASSRRPQSGKYRARWSKLRGLSWVVLRKRPPRRIETEKGRHLLGRSEIIERMIDGKEERDRGETQYETNRQELLHVWNRLRLPKGVSGFHYRYGDRWYEVTFQFPRSLRVNNRYRRIVMRLLGDSAPSLMGDAVLHLGLIVGDPENLADLEAYLVRRYGRRLTDEMLSLSIPNDKLTERIENGRISPKILRYLDITYLEPRIKIKPL